MVVVCLYIDRFQWTRVDNVVASRRKEEKKSRTFCRRRRRSNAAMTNASGRCVGREKSSAGRATHAWAAISNISWKKKGGLVLVGVFLEAEGDVSDIRARPKVNDQTNGEREGVRGRLPVLRIREPPPPRMNRFVVKRFRWRRKVAADRIDPVIKSEGKKYFFVVFDCAEFLGTDLYRRLRSSLLAPERKPKAGRYGDEK